MHARSFCGGGASPVSDHVQHSTQCGRLVEGACCTPVCLVQHKSTRCIGHKLVSQGAKTERFNLQTRDLQRSCYFPFLCGVSSEVPHLRIADADVRGCIHTSATISNRMSHCLIRNQGRDFGDSP